MLLPIKDGNNKARARRSLLEPGLAGWLELVGLDGDWWLEHELGAPSACPPALQSLCT